MGLRDDAEASINNNWGEPLDDLLDWLVANAERIAEECWAREQSEYGERSINPLHIKAMVQVLRDRESVEV